MNMRLTSLLTAGLLAVMAASFSCASSNRAAGGTGGLERPQQGGLDVGAGGFAVADSTGGVSGSVGQGGYSAAGGSPAGTLGGSGAGKTGGLSLIVGGATGVGAAGATATSSGGNYGATGGWAGLGGSGGGGSTAQGKPHLIIDSDTNNEIDDQHAIAYALFNADQWYIDGITTNATFSGGKAPEHTLEAQRVVQLCDSQGTVKVYTGATGAYQDIKAQLGQADYDGKAAVDFIILKAAPPRSATDKLILIAIGKLTNIALALDKDPSIADRMRVIWLGSNWPNPGEYNLINDPPAVSRLVDSNVELDIATVRENGEPQPATAAVKVTLDEMKSNMGGKGPQVQPVLCRNGKQFTCFGDYSVYLMEQVGQTRALFDLSAVALFKNPTWAIGEDVQAPQFDGSSWSNRGRKDRTVTFWRSFNRDGIVNDLFARASQPQLQR